MKFNTGIYDLDKVLNSDGLDMVPMNIDKEMFDAGILPLLIDYTLQLTDDERFQHLYNIWINYYMDTTGRIPNSVQLSREDREKIVPINGLYIPMRIIDTDGTIVAVTPPLIEPVIIPGMSEILDGYKVEHLSNPMTANAKLISTFKSLSFTKSDAWAEFFKAYGVEKKEGSVEEDQGLLEG